MVDVLRFTVAALACLVAGSTAVIAFRYIAAAYRLGRAPGRILARHVAEVSAGTCGLVLGYAMAVYQQLGGWVPLGVVGRLWLYLVSMILLLVGVIEVGNHRRREDRQSGRHHREQP